MKAVFIMTALAGAFTLSACATPSGCQNLEQSLIAKYGNASFIAKINRATGYGESNIVEQKALIDEALSLPNLNPYARSYAYRALGSAYVLNKDYKNGLVAMERAMKEGGFTGIEGEGFPEYVGYVRKAAENKEKGVSDYSDAQPIVRIPPIMPPWATRSGHCQMQFDVDEKGNTYNVKALYCTQDVFSEASIASLSRWKYNPKIVSGKPAKQTGVTSKIAYKLVDECGNLLTE